MTMTRRNVLQGMAAAGAIATTASCAQLETDAVRGEMASSQSPTLAMPDLATQLMLNPANAHLEMAAAGVDLLVCSDPVNVFYLTNQRLVSNSLGMDGGAYATLAAAADARPALITGEFSYYLSSDDQVIPDQVDLKLFSSPAEPDVYQHLTDPDAIVSAPASAGYMTPAFDVAPARDYETARRSVIKAAGAEMVATSESALLKALQDTPLPNRTVAVDDPRLIETLKRSGLNLRYVDGERLLRRIRLQKSQAEIVYARYAALANAAAGLEAAKTIAAGATFQDLRQEFAKRCGEQLTTPVYMLIDGVLSPLREARVERGRSFLIDCVSTFEGYHGDYGRTVCVGEPTRQMQQVVDALSHVWDRVLPELKVGKTYADIWALGQKLFAETGVDAGLVMGPHAVGLHHTDEPGAKEFAPFEKENLTLQENMIISVDMPVLGSGLGGTAHLEDLVLIGKDGPELLNATMDRFIVV